MATVSGAPLAAVNVEGAGATVTTDAGGRYSLSGTATGALPFTVSGAGILSRELSIRAGDRADVRLDAISTAAPFSLDIYREMVHNGKEEPDRLQPTRRLERAPHFHITATHETTGQPITATDVASIEAIIRQVVPQWSAGAYQATVSSGPADAAPSGAVVIRFVSQLEGSLDGLATIGALPGRIDLRYPSRFPCAGRGFEMGTVAHEVGHSLGFYHHNAAGLLGTREHTCSTPNASSTERFHAALAYARPRGNRYPDTSPSGAGALLMPFVVRD